MLTRPNGLVRDRIQRPATELELSREKTLRNLGASCRDTKCRDAESHETNVSFL